MSTKSSRELARQWKSDDILALLSKYRVDGASKTGLRKDKAKFKGLLNQKTLVLNTKHHSLIFESSLILTHTELAWLLGDDWYDLQQAHAAKASADIKILGQSIMLDLSNVPDAYSLPFFNVLAREAGVKVRSVYDHSLREIPPVVNIAIALSLQACKRGRGMFCWQPKERRNNLHQQAWHVVPDIIYSDFIWLQDEASAFLDFKYEDLRDSLNADTTLPSDEIVLPFSLDFPGHRQANDSDARVIAYLDGKTSPLAAISVPGRAYIGWVKDMVPYTGSSDFFTHYRHKTPKYESQYLLSELQRSQTSVPDVAAMYEKAILMYDAAISGALLLYRDVLQAKIRASKLHSSRTDAEVGNEIMVNNSRDRGDLEGVGIE